MKKILRLFLLILCALSVFLTQTAMPGIFAAPPGSLFRGIGRAAAAVAEPAGGAAAAAAELTRESAAAVAEITGEAVSGIAGMPLADTAGPAGKKAEPDGGTPGETDGKTGRQTKDEIFYYYYTCISKEERLLYDAMLGLAEGASEKESRIVGIDPSSEEFAERYTRAYNALVSDHPELFWIAQARVSFECRYFVVPSFGGKYKVVLSLSGSKDDFVKEQKKLEESADALLQKADLDRSDAEIALQLHDLLIENAWYNKDAGPDDYAHTAYGALVENSSGIPGGALCDGYSLAYEYLLQRAGVTCTMVCGYAGSSQDDLQKHAWNLVRLGEDWYEVDPTWDDLDLEISPSGEGYELFLEAVSDKDYMDRLHHYMFNRTTEQMRSFTPGDEYTYTGSSGWVSLLQPSVHIRFTPQDSEATRDFVTPLAPDAEGTLYTWEMLTGGET